MLEKPDLDDALLISRLSDSYGVRAAALTFLPLGADAGTAVYRVDAHDGGAYFLKLRRGAFDENTVAVPSFLSEQGIAQIIAPLPTLAGELWSRLEPFTLTLYPFVDGEDGYTVSLSERQWIEFGAVLKRIHSARLPAALERALPRETYSPHWREQVRAFQSRLSAATFQDPVAADLAAFMNARRGVVDELAEAADKLAQILQGRPRRRVLCHADIHAGNLLLTLLARSSLSIGTRPCSPPSSAT